MRERRRFRAWLLLSGAVGLVALQFKGLLPLAAVSLLVWMVLLKWLEPLVFRRTFRPKLWGMTVILALLSGLLIGEPDFSLFGLSLSSSGLLAGGWMIIRGITLLTLTALGAQAATRDGFTRRLRRLGFAQAADTIQVAVQTLPAAQDSLITCWRHHRTQRPRLVDLPWVVDACVLTLLEDTARRAIERGGLVDAREPELVEEPALEMGGS